MPKRTFSTVCGGRNAAFFIVCGPFVTGLDMDVVLLFVIFLVGRNAIFGSSTSNSEGRWPCSVLGRPSPSTSVASISWRRSVLPSINCCSKVTRDSNTDSAVRHREASPVSRWINTFIWSVYSGKFRQNPSMMSLVKVKPSATPPAGQGSGPMTETRSKAAGDSPAERSRYGRSAGKDNSTGSGVRQVPGGRRAPAGAGALRPVPAAQDPGILPVGRGTTAVRGVDKQEKRRRKNGKVQGVIKIS